MKIKVKNIYLMSREQAISIACELMPGTLADHSIVWGCMIFDRTTQLVGLGDH